MINVDGPDPEPPGGIRNSFEISGEYLDRTLGNEQPILTHWQELEVVG